MAVSPQEFGQYLAEVWKYLEPIGKAAQDAAKTGLYYATKHAFAEGVGDIVISLGLVALGGYISSKHKQYMTKTDLKWYESEAIILLSMLAWMLRLACAIFALVWVYEGIQRVVSPEWYAIQDISNLIHKNH